MSPMDHLSPADKATYLDRLAYWSAVELAKQQQATTLYRGQAAIAAFLGCSRATAGKLLAEQRIPYSRIGAKGYCCTHAQLTTYLQNAS